VRAADFYNVVLDREFDLSEFDEFTLQRLTIVMGVMAVYTLTVTTFLLSMAHLFTLMLMGVWKSQLSSA